MKYRALATMLVLALCIWSAQAQSGRKHVKTAPAAPVPTPTPEPTPVPKKAEKESSLLFYVGADRNDTYATFPFTYYDAVVKGCADRLRAGSSADVDVTDRSLSRGEAIKKAKSDTGTYVVLLTLRLDSMARSYDDLVLEFVVFAPGTAKVTTSGNSYPTGTRAGRVVVDPGTASGALYRERLLQRAGEDAGNRILKALHVDVNIPRRPNSFTPDKAPQLHLDTSHR